MTEQFVIHIAREAIYNTVPAAAPMLGLALIIGFAVGIFQAVTSINEMTLTFVPKIIIVMAAIVVFSPWILNIMMNFTVEIMNQLPLVSR